MSKLLQMPLLFEELLLSPEVDDTSAPLPLPQPAAPSLVSANPRLDIADAPQRLAALDIRRSWIVEAPAGSGKTGLLIQRFLKLLGQADLERPDQVLAITFTRKADAEMRRRVLDQLAAARAEAALVAEATPFDRGTRDLAQKVLERDLALGWNLLDNPHQLNIRTIDSLCAEVATSTPVHTGPGGRYSPTDDPDPLYALAAERTLARLGGPEQLSSDLELLLLHRDALPGDVQRLLADMLRHRSEWGELIPIDAEALTEDALNQTIRPRLERTLGRLLGEELELAAIAVGPSLLERLARLAFELSSYPELPAGSPLALCGTLPAAPGTRAEALPHWTALVSLLLTAGGDWRQKLDKGTLKVQFSKAHFQEWKELLEAFQIRELESPGLADTLCRLRDLPEPQLPEESWLVIKALCRVLRAALLELQIVFGERQSCDFTEVALAARTVLQGDIPGVDASLAPIANLRHLLVDEMQDTSAGQYELLETVIQSWDGGTQTVFLVGDPKQSIYEFRQARVERFRRVMDDGRFGQLTLGALRLTANFRSQAALVQAFNQTFERILPPPDDPALTADSPEVAFVRAEPTRVPAVDPALHWHVPASPAEAGSDAHAQEAQQLREVVEDFQRRWNSDPNRRRTPKIAVLGRARSHLADVIRRFHTDQGSGPLPFRAVEIEALHERPEILDLLSLTRALLDPGDRVAWLAVLRSPLCGLSLPDLLALTGDMPEGASQTPLLWRIEQHLAELSDDGRTRLAQAGPVLLHAAQTVGQSAFHTHVERTWRSLGGDAPLQAHEKANALRFLDLLATLEAGPDALHLPLIQRRLRSLYAEPSHPDAPVELMTIHKAKGLEWDLVLVPGLERGSGRGDQEFLKWLEFDDPGGTPEFLLAPIQSKGEAASKLSSWMNRRQRGREDAEAKRLLYVACTRAREELHLFGTVALKADATLTEPKRSSLLTAAWPVAEPEVVRQAEPQPGRGTLVAFPEPESQATEGLALAAAGEAAPPPEGTPGVRRLLRSFHPLERFSAARGPGLPYPAADQLPQSAVFSRPEGSFSARAFGNTLHRFLNLTAERLSLGISPADLLRELPGWHGRLVAVLRSEGLPPGEAPGEAQRALQALTRVLQDPTGQWLLGPRAEARNEAQIPSLHPTLAASLRADRTFFAGPSPLENGDASFLWIVDYKTAELGGRHRNAFLETQQQKYAPQMDAYAASAVQGGFPQSRVRLALYFPMLPALLFWSASDQKEAVHGTFGTTDLQPSFSE